MDAIPKWKKRNVRMMKLINICSKDKEYGGDDINIIFYIYTHFLTLILIQTLNFLRLFYIMFCLNLITMLETFIVLISNFSLHTYFLLFIFRLVNFIIVFKVKFNVYFFNG